MLLILGATGNVGSAASARLCEAEVPHRILVRDPSRLKQRSVSLQDIMVGDLENESDVRRAFEGVSGALIVSANGENQNELETNVTTLATALGTKHIVKISSMEASAKAQSSLSKSHFQVEEHIKSLGVKWTILRPNYYMQNFFMASYSIQNADRFELPLGETRVATIDASDIGRIAARVLSSPAAHFNQTYELNGPELISFETAAAVASSALGRRITYEKLSSEAFRAQLSKIVASNWRIDAVANLFEEIEAGALIHHSRDAETLLGHPPRTLKSFFEAHRSVFNP